MIISETIGRIASYFARKGSNHKDETVFAMRGKIASYLAMTKQYSQ
jgi:hypothetical protein